MAELHGRPWIEWQHIAGDIIGEMTPDGNYAYPVFVILVPRQCGKTTFIFDIMQGRAGEYRDYRAAYCAQTGHVTTERFGERMTELPDDLAPRIKCRFSQGTERMSWQNKSFVKAFPPRDGALRGSALDLVVVDEPQEIEQDRGHALDQTILPTFTTRRRRQLILIGTAGNDRSGYLARYLAAAQSGAKGVGVLLYGAEADEDPSDPKVWHARHPGLAAGLTDEGALQAAFAVMGPGGYAREYLNVWQTASDDRIIPVDAWQAIARPHSRPKAIAPTLGAAVSIDRSAACIAACWPSEDGVLTLEVVDYRLQTDWVAPRLLELARHGTIWTDSAGPALTVADDVRRASLERNIPVAVEQTDTAAWSAACAGTLDRIIRGQVHHRDDQSLNVAVAGANRRLIGDGAWAWGRRSSSADISPLEAATLALWGHLHAAPAKRRPVAA